MVSKAGLKVKPQGDLLIAVRRQFGGEFFVYFVNIVCYQGMKEGWKDGRNASNHVRSLDSLCAKI